jgi:hypothetical protein
MLAVGVVDKAIFFHLAKMMETACLLFMREWRR